MDRLEPFLNRLRYADFKPSLIIDVGANKANWTHRAWDNFPKADFILIEPLESFKGSADLLIQNGAKIKWITAGVGDSVGESYLSVGDRDDNSSFVPSDEQAKAWGMEQVRVPMTTLNRVVQENGECLPDLLKIDAEGYDLKVLNGASDMLGKTEVILIEVSICAPLVENTAHHVITRMGEAGYSLIEITHLNENPNTGALWLAEFAFCLDDSPIWNWFRRHS